MKYLPFLIAVIFTLTNCNYLRDNKKKAVEYNNSAMSLLVNDKIDSARILIDKAIDIDPFEYQWHANKYTILMKKHDHEKALESIKSALNLKPDFAEAALIIGIYYDYHMNKSSAILYFDSSLSIYNNRIKNEDSCINRFNRAFVYLLKSDSLCASKDIAWLMTSKCDSFTISIILNFDKDKYYEDIFK